MLQMGIIEHSDSPYASPFVIVKKSDGSNRFCVDYRKLNRITIFDAEPVGNADQIFTKLKKGKYFTKLDLTKGCWQIKMKDTCIPLTFNCIHYIRRSICISQNALWFSQFGSNIRSNDAEFVVWSRSG